MEDTVAAVTDVLDCEEHHATGVFNRRQPTTFWSKASKRVRQHPGHFIYFGAEAIVLVVLVVLTAVFAADSEQRCELRCCAYACGK